MSCKSLDVQYGGYANETSRLVFKNVFKTLFIKKYMISIFYSQWKWNHTHYNQYKHVSEQFITFPTEWVIFPDAKQNFDLGWCILGIISMVAY